MMNRRTFLGAAVAATILPAGEAAAAPVIRPTATAKETSTPGCYEVIGGGRRTASMVSMRHDSALTLVADGFAIVSCPVIPHDVRFAVAPSPVFPEPPSPADVLAFHERCCAEDGDAASRG